MRLSICSFCLGLMFAMGMAALAFRFSAEPGPRETQSECVVSLRSDSRLTDVGNYVDDLLKLRECDVIKEAIGWLVCERRIDRAAIGSACAALAGVAVNRQSDSKNKCRVVVMATSDDAGLSHAAAKAYAHGLKTVIDQDERRMADKSTEEAQLNVFKARIRLSVLTEVSNTIGNDSPTARDRIGDAIKDAQGQVSMMEENEGRIRRGIKASRLNVTIIEQARRRTTSATTGCCNDM